MTCAVLPCRAVQREVAHLLRYVLPVHRSPTRTEYHCEPLDPGNMMVTLQYRLVYCMDLQLARPCLENMGENIEMGSLPVVASGRN